MKNVEKADRIHLGSLVENLKKGHFLIPDFQREFEWDPWDVEDLIKSIFQDYYIGTILLWKGSKENFNLLSCEHIYSYHGSPDPQHIVLDGQQRLTAIYYAFFQPNKPFPNRSRPIAYFLNIQAFIEEDYDKAIWYDFLTRKNKELVARKERQFEQHIFPLGTMKEGTWGTADWIKSYRDYWLNKAESETGDNEASQDRKNTYQHFAGYAKTFKDFIEELFNQYYISYIELDRDIDIAKVCEIFTQINSKGVKLDMFDLLNAILRPKDIFLKKMWHDAEEALNFTDAKKMKIYVLQVMSILQQSYCSAKYLYYLVPEAVKSIKKPDGSLEKIVLIENSDEFVNHWHRSVSALKKGIQSLKSPRDYGAIQPQYVPYHSIIPAFSAIKAHVEDENYVNKLDIQSKIRKWYWASVFTNRYSSAVESTSAKDFQDLKRWFLNDEDEPEVIAEFVGKFKNIDLLNDNQKGSAIYNAIFNLFVIKGARDWSTFDLPEYDSLDDHHIVPLSVLGETAGSTINSILNKTPLAPETNRHIIRNRLPNKYLKEMLENNDQVKVYEILSSHLISKKTVSILLRDPFNKQDFDEFLQERLITIRSSIEELLIKEIIEIPTSLRELNNAIEKIELKIRELLATTAGNSLEQYKAFIPGHIQEKVDKRISTELRRRPDLSLDSFASHTERLKYFDLFEYFDVISSSQNWKYFQTIFKTKEQLNNRFGQLSTLRNCIRHSREVTVIEKYDGEAAISWFNLALGI